MGLRDRVRVSVRGMVPYHGMHTFQELVHTGNCGNLILLGGGLPF